MKPAPGAGHCPVFHPRCYSCIIEKERRDLEGESLPFLVFLYFPIEYYLPQSKSESWIPKVQF